MCLWISCCSELLKTYKGSDLVLNFLRLLSVPSDPARMRAVHLPDRLRYKHTKQSDANESIAPQDKVAHCTHVDKKYDGDAWRNIPFISRNEEFFEASHEMLLSDLLILFHAWIISNDH